MKLLSLDTSFSFLNLTLIEDGKVILCHYVDDGKKTLEHIPTLLKRLDISPKDVDAYAVSVGVGYLTSLRIGITFMKTLAYLGQKPLVAYENLHIMCTYLKGARKVALKVSNNIFCMDCERGIIQTLREKDPEAIGLKIQGLGDLEFFPFSLYGGLWAYEKLKSGYKGDNPMFLEPIYLRPPV